MEEYKENIFVGYPNIISYECIKKIKEQMEKNICKINLGKSQGTRNWIFLQITISRFK